MDIVAFDGCILNDLSDACAYNNLPEFEIVRAYFDELEERNEAYTKITRRNRVYELTLDYVDEFKLCKRMETTGLDLKTAFSTLMDYFKIISSEGSRFNDKHWIIGMYVIY